MATLTEPKLIAGNANMALSQAIARRMSMHRGVHTGLLDARVERKFHMDAVVARLVCTYRGSGTQYGTSVAGGDPEVIARVATGSPIVMRGSLWPETPKSGLLHRSPPIEGSGETRLLFVLDPVSDPEQTADLHHLH